VEMGYGEEKKRLCPMRGSQILTEKETRGKKKRKAPFKAHFWECAWAGVPAEKKKKKKTVSLPKAPKKAKPRGGSQKIAPSHRKNGLGAPEKKGPEKRPAGGAEKKKNFPHNSPGGGKCFT